MKISFPWSLITLSTISTAMTTTIETTNYYFDDDDLMTAFESWKYSWIGAILCAVPLLFQYVLWKRLIIKCRVKCSGHETKAWIERKYSYETRRRKGGKSTHYCFSVQYVTKHKLDSTTVYALYRDSIEHSRWLYKRYEETNVIDIKYLSYTNRQNESIFYHKHHMLKEQLDAVREWICTFLTYLCACILTAPWFIVAGLLYYSYGGYLAVLFWLLNTVIAIGFPRFLCCPFCGYICCECNISKYKDDPFWLKDGDKKRKDQIITEQEYDVFILEKLNSSNEVEMGIKNNTAMTTKIGE